MDWTLSMGGAAVVLATAVWAVRDHVRDGGWVTTAPFLAVWIALGVTVLTTLLVLVALLIALALVAATLPLWAPIDLTS